MSECGVEFMKGMYVYHSFFILHVRLSGSQINIFFNVFFDVFRIFFPIRF